MQAPFTESQLPPASTHSTDAPVQLDTSRVIPPKIARSSRAPPMKPPSTLFEKADKPPLSALTGHAVFR